MAAMAPTGSGLPNGAPEAPDDGPLVFQRGKKLNDQYYIVSVRDNQEASVIKFSAYELESSETFELCYSYGDFEELFKADPELSSSAKKEERYDWIVDRIDFTTSGGNGGTKHLTLASSPTMDDEGKADGGGPLAPKAAARGRPHTYAERMRLRAEAEKLEEKRAASIALKAEKNRKAFVAELQEKRKLEELKAAARRRRIDEERAERREQAEMQKRLNEEKQKRYAENDRKREQHIEGLLAERKARDLVQIKEIIEASNNKKEALRQRLEDARKRKLDVEAEYNAQMEVKRDAQEKLDNKREANITARQERQKQAELEYLEYRAKQIEKIAREKEEQGERKQAYLAERASQRAAKLRLKHEKMVAWEQLEDQRLQANMMREQARNQLMLEHIEGLRQVQRQEEEEASARKQVALGERKEREAREAEEHAELMKQKSALEQKRNRNIAQREAVREQRNQQYCDYIRDLKTKEALRIKDQLTLVSTARDQARQQRSEERRMKAVQENAASLINSLREENIRARAQLRDQKFSQYVTELKEADKEQQLQLEAKKIQRRLQEKEKSDRLREEEAQRRKQAAMLEEQREVMIRERVAERDRREQDRLRTGQQAQQAQQGQGQQGQQGQAGAGEAAGAPSAEAAQAAPAEPSGAAPTPATLTDAEAEEAAVRAASKHSAATQTNGSTSA